MIFYFDFKIYRRMVSLAWSEPNALVRRYYLTILFFWIPLASSFHAVCFFLDGLLFPGLWTTKVENPVFVLGHARSGTTLVHRLMSKDSDRFSSFVLYEMYFPSLLQKKLIRAVARADARLLGSRLAARVSAWEDKRYAKTRKVHSMGLTQPEEDDMVLYYSCASGYWVTKMPYMGDLDFYGVDEWSPRRRKRIMRFYRACVQRQLYLNGSDKIHLSKNPIFAGRVEALIETFPGARFVVPFRNPYETIPSLLSLVGMGWKRLKWDPERVGRCLRVLADQSFHTYRYPLEVLERHPETRYAVVDYRELVANPAATIGKVYEELDLPMSEGFAASLAGEGRKAEKHVSAHRYSLEKFGLDADEIRRQLPEFFERFGWAEPNQGENR